MSLEDTIEWYFNTYGYTDENIKELLTIVSKIFNEYIIKKEEK